MRYELWVQILLLTSYELWDMSYELWVWGMPVDKVIWMYYFLRGRFLGIGREGGLIEENSHLLQQPFFLRQWCVEGDDYLIVSAGRSVVGLAAGGELTQAIAIRSNMRRGGVVRSADEVGDSNLEFFVLRPSEFVSRRPQLSCRLIPAAIFSQLASSALFSAFKWRHIASSSAFKRPIDFDWLFLLRKGLIGSLAIRADISVYTFLWETIFSVLVDLFGPNLCTIICFDRIFWAQIQRYS